MATERRSRARAALCLVRTSLDQGQAGPDAVFPLAAGVLRDTSLHRTEVSQVERGLRLCRIDTLVKLAASLEVSADDLLAGITWSLGDYRPGGFVERSEE
jgi:hypothetical protein